MAGHCQLSSPLDTRRRQWHNAGFSVSTFPAPCFDDYCGHPSTEDLCSTASGCTDPLRENIEKDDAGVRREINNRWKGITNFQKSLLCCDLWSVGFWGFPSVDAGHNSDLLATRPWRIISPTVRRLTVRGPHPEREETATPTPNFDDNRKRIALS